MQREVDSVAVAPATSTPRRWDTWLCVSAFVLTCAFLFSLPYAEPDLWGHVQYGLDLLRAGLPQTTTYSYTAEGYPWINHENLAEILMAWTYVQAGVPGLLIGKCFSGLALLGLIAWHARRRHVSWIVIAFTLLITATTFASFWQTRPQLASYLLFGCLIFTLDRAFRGWHMLPRNWRALLARDDAAAVVGITPLRRSPLHWLWLLPVLFVIWANSHGGFVAGGAVAITYISLRACELVAGRHWRAWPQITMLAGAVALAALATCATPYGIRLHLWLVGSLGTARPEITEWAPLSFTSEPYLPTMALLLFTVIGLSASRRALDPTQLVLLAIVCWQALAHQRHVPFLAILVAMWLPVHWESTLTRLKASWDALGTWTKPCESRWMLGLMCGVNLILVIALVPRLASLKVDRTVYPVDAIQFMAENRLSGRLVVTYNWAQYAIAALGNEHSDEDGVLVAFDGRFRTCYPREVIDQHFDFVFGNETDLERARSKSTSIDPHRVLEHGSPNLVLISRLQVPSVQVMQSHQDQWTLLYQDALAQVWGRRDEFDDPTSRRYLPPNKREVAERIPVGFAHWPALPTDSGTTHPVATTDKPIQHQPQDTGQQTSHGANDWNIQ